MELTKAWSPLLVTFTLPCLDYKIVAHDTKIHERHCLEVDGEKAMPREQQELIQKDPEIRNCRVTYFPGGNGVLTEIMFQRISGNPCQSVIFGAICDDKEGKYLCQQLEKQGVVVMFDHIDSTRTAFCLVLQYQNYRSVAAFNGPGEFYAMNNACDFKKKVQMANIAKIVFFCGFFVRFSYDITKSIISYCRPKGTTICINLSSTYVIQEFTENIADITKLADILIGNRKEFETFSKVLMLHSTTEERDLSNIVKACQLRMLSERCLTSFKLNNMKQFKKIVIVTDGPNPCYCAYGSDSKVIIHPIPWIPVESIKDTGGAGDSFLGGFLFGLTKEKSIKECLTSACHTAINFIQQNEGYTLPHTHTI